MVACHYNKAWRLDHFIHTNQAAEMLGRSEESLRRMRADGTGPPFFRAFRRVLYKLSDVESWKPPPPREFSSRRILYRTWSMMKQRCSNPNLWHWKHYGGRGIIVCDRWEAGEDDRTGFECFLEDMGLKPAGKTLDRWPDNDGNYEPGNCRWATPKEQAVNKRRPQKETELISLKTIESLHPNSILWDSGKGSVTGFGARRQKSKAISYILKYRTAPGRQRYHTIGHHSPWTPNMARAEAHRILVKAASKG